MNLSNYYQQQENQTGITFTKEQGSNFAKRIANDFNPIHDVDAKKFCVPGDLLFSVMLENYGLAQKMCFKFSGMVGDNVLLNLPKRVLGSDEVQNVSIADENDKEYLNFDASGKVSHDKDLISKFTQAYVKFSGKAFPHLLVPLMEQENVMINPDRPLVIYENMSIQLERLDIQDLNLQLYKTGIDVNGKRGTVCLEFELLSGSEKVGCGKKNMILSGLREYDAEKIAILIENYNERSQKL